MKKAIILAAAIAALCACQSTLDPERLAKESEISFFLDGEFASQVSTTKAATATEVTSLSKFNVNCVTGTLGSSEASVFNSEFTKESTGSNYKGGKYWPSTDATYKFYASNVAMTAAATGPTVSAANTTDVVCALSKTPTFQSSNALTFNHIFARIAKCTITGPGNGYSVSGLTVKVTPKTGGTYNLFTGDGETDGTGWSSTTTGSETTIATDLSQTSDNGLYLVPGSYTLTAKYTLTKGDFVKEYTKTSTVSLVAGKKNNISATLPDAGSDLKEIVFTVTVTAWSDNNINATFN